MNESVFSIKGGQTHQNEKHDEDSDDVANVVDEHRAENFVAGHAERIDFLAQLDSRVVALEIFAAVEVCKVALCFGSIRQVTLLARILEDAQLLGA